jgi:hypothetical protein
MLMSSDFLFYILHLAIVIPLSHSPGSTELSIEEGPSEWPNLVQEPENLHILLTILGALRTLSSTYDHRCLKARDPVRSPIDKQTIARLVLGWVTTGESLVLYVFFFFFFFFFWHFGLFGLLR